MKPERAAETDCRRELTLLENFPLRFTNAKGWRIRCVSGSVLITAYKMPEDFELRPNEVFVVPNNGLALVEGIGRSHVRVECPDPEPQLLDRLRRKLTSLREYSVGMRLKQS